MATFNFVVDRQYVVTKPVSMHGDLALMTEPFTVEPEYRVVYRGTVELTGAPRFVFDVLGQDKKGYTRDRTQLEAALAEDYDALLKA